MGEVPELSEGEIEVGYGPERMWRQMTKHIWDEVRMRPGTLAFQPSTADAGMPSFSRETKVTAQASRDWHQKNARSASLAVWPIATSDVEDTGLRIVDDEDAALPQGEKRAPGHAYIDYRGTSNATRRDVRAKLLRRALQYQEEPTTDSGFVPLEERDEEAS